MFQPIKYLINKLYLYAISISQYFVTARPKSINTIEEKTIITNLL